MTKKFKKKMEDLMHMDLYGLLDIPTTATPKEIKTAYRKKALSCHPDKNPDNPRAGELFLQLSKILEILTDVSARSAYDKVLQAKAQAKIRSEKLDAKRKKFKDDLEAREESFRSSGQSGKSAEQKLREEIERLQKEGSKLVEEEVSFINQQIHQQMRKDQSNAAKRFKDDPEMSGKVKIKWRADKNDAENGGYNQEVLNRIFAKYGDVVGLVVSSKRGRALVEFRERSAAEMAVKIETGLMGNALVLQGLWEDEEKKETRRSTLGMGGESRTASSRIFPSSGSGFGGRGNTFPSFSSAPDIFGDRGNDNDFENLVLGNLRRAEERKKLIQQMTEEEEKS